MKGVFMMKRKILAFILAAAMISAPFAGFAADSQAAYSGVCTAWAQEKKEKNDKQALAKADMKPVQQFGYQLMKQYLSEENPVMSPVSAYVMLSMAGNGTKGATKKEFQKVLGNDMLSVSESIMNTLPQEKEGTQLTIANSAWMDYKFTPQKKWLGTAKKQFQSDVFEADLDTDAAKNKINAWVSERTNELIPKLLDKKLDQAARLALVNALYFHADWKQQFVPEFTWEAEFSLDNGKSVKTDMMHATVYQCGYFKNKTAEGVVLPYKDSHFAFAAVKPSGKQSIQDWYASYSAEKLAELVESRQTKTVKLSLPKFESRCRMQLNDSLKKIGIKKAFDAKKADFSLIGKSKEDENLYLSFVLQEAVITVAEEGTEAAAATMGAIAAGSAMMPDTPVVDFDRTFLYMILDLDTGAPVFMGILDQP